MSDQHLPIQYWLDTHSDTSSQASFRSVRAKDRRGEEGNFIKMTVWKDRDDPSPVAMLASPAEVKILIESLHNMLKHHEGSDG